MRNRLVDIGSLSSEDERRWRSLAERAAEPNPFHEPDFLGLAASHFEGYARTRMVVAEDGDAWRAMLPVVGDARLRVPPRLVATTKAEPTAVSGVATPLVDRDHVDAAVGSLLQALSEGARRQALPGVVMLEPMSDSGPVAAALRRQAAARRLPLHATGRWVRGSVSRQGRLDNPLDGQRRREIGRRRRQLTKERGAEVRLVDLSRDPAPDAFLALEASGWKGEGRGSAFARSDAAAAWFREWCRRWAASGRLVMLSLEVGTTPVAMQCFARAGDGLFWIRTAFDESYRRQAPGAMLLSDAFEFVRDSTDVQWIDSNTDRDNAFALEMFPERLSSCTVYVGSGGILDRRAVAAMPAIERLKHVRRTLRRQVTRSRRAVAGRARGAATLPTDASADHSS